MMTMYVSKSFIAEFELRKDLSDELVYDFRRVFLKKVRGIKLVIELASISEFRDLAAGNEFYNDLTEIGGANTLFDASWLESFDACIAHDTNPTKLFLIGNNLNALELSYKHDWLFINNQSLCELWNPVRYNRDIRELTPEQMEGMYSFHSWQVFQREKHPFKELLILDLFLLEDKAGRRMANNIIPMIREMQRLTSSKLSVWVISDRMLNSPDGKKYEKLQKAFEQLKEACPEVEIGLIHYDKENKSSFQKGTGFIPEHDREMYTNYLKFYCGAGWNLFNDQNIIAGNRTTITIDSLFRNDVRNSAKRAFENLRIYKQQIKDGIEKLAYGKFDENGNLIKVKETLQLPKNGKSLLLQC